MSTVGVVSPGAMGSAMADALARGGARVVATLSGRSERTARLADRARIECLPDLAAVVREADVVFSIVPPEVAPLVAQDLMSASALVTLSHKGPHEDVRPLIADLNAIAPMQALLTARANGVLEHVLADLATASPALVAGVERRLAFQRSCRSRTCSTGCGRSCLCSGRSCEPSQT